MCKTPENINLIWKHTHTDFKSANGGKKSVMWLENGATVLGPITQMPHQQFIERLSFSQRKETCFERDRKLKKIYIDFGLGEFFASTGQFRETFQEVLDSFIACIGTEVLERVSNVIRDAFVVFPSGPDTDGLIVPGGMKELKDELPGSLEVVIQRPSCKVSRYFSGEEKEICELYKLALSNPYVIQVNYL
ncbi:hypothetical protein [Shewanella xiamenensis]|uniref:hypothetical protein n=1 Tax=Shewanella xiamenensis TaxID=332186 RepID=UPI0021BFE925|nr:hypothetical protein [Shewanella xiamenensis]MCT8873764.1 hypothetical protein [Shewanella xiamenensis]